MLTAQRLREVLDYSPETGAFRWRIDTGKRRRVGNVAGHAAKGGANDGYVFIRIDRRLYRAHRLAWLYVHGVWPEHEIDHRDLNRANNRIGNLRPATRQQNAANSPLQRNNTSGRKGVRWWSAREKWRAEIHLLGRSKHLGLYATFEEAVEARRNAEVLHFGQFARVA